MKIYIVLNQHPTEARLKPIKIGSKSGVMKRVAGKVKLKITIPPLGQSHQIYFDIKTLRRYSSSEAALRRLLRIPTFAEVSCFSKLSAI